MHAQCVFYPATLEKEEGLLVLFLGLGVSFAPKNLSADTLRSTAFKK